jgi:hypothetical protein
MHFYDLPFQDDPAAEKDILDIISYVKNSGVKV